MSIVWDIIALAGLIMLAAAGWLLHPSLAFMVGGVACLGLGLWGASRWR